MPKTNELYENQMPHTIMIQPGEGLFSAWLRGLNTVPPEHFGPIVIRWLRSWPGDNLSAPAR